MSTNNLGVRARRSKKAIKERETNGLRDPMLDHTIDTDLPYIQEYAQLFKQLPKENQEMLNKFVFPGKSLDYYYGSYVNAYQTFVITFTSNNEIAPTIMSLVHAISARIVDTIKSQKDVIEAAETIDDIGNKKQVKNK